MRIPLDVIRTAAVLSIVLAAAAAPGIPRASAAAPPPLDPQTFAFPGALVAPASAVSAGLAFSDRWLVAGAFDNPAIASPPGLQVSPALLRVNRQDLRAANRETDEQAAFFDFGGASLSLPAGHGAITLNVYQPRLRLENTAFTKGPSIVLGPPATVTTDAAMREMRAGLGASIGTGALRLGVTAEWTHRDDRYSVIEASGDPDAGTRTLTFSGDAFGGALGVRLERSPEHTGGIAIGAGVRLAPALDVSGTSTSELVSGDTAFAVAATRGATVEGGATARVTLSRESAAFLSLGARSGERWDGFGVEASPATDWHAGVQYHDEETPWSARLGFGQEVQPGTPEPRAVAFGVGVGWTDRSLSLDVGYLRRSFARPARATSYDHRVVASVGVAF